MMITARRTTKTQTRKTPNRKHRIPAQRKINNNYLYSMFDLFKKNENKGPKDVKAVRDTLLRFIKEELQKAEGGEGRNIKTVNIFICSVPGENHVYEAAVYLAEKN